MIASYDGIMFDYVLINCKAKSLLVLNGKGPEEDEQKKKFYEHIWIRKWENIRDIPISPMPNERISAFSKHAL